MREYTEQDTLDAHFTQCTMADMEAEGTDDPRAVFETWSPPGTPDAKAEKDDLMKQYERGKAILAEADLVYSSERYQRGLNWPKPPAGLLAVIKVFAGFLATRECYRFAGLRPHTSR